MRILRKLKAMLLFTFLAECPRCLKHFYGYHKYEEQVKAEKHYRIICHRCSKELK